MTTEPQPSAVSADPAPRPTVAARRKPSVAARHARALYRPAPPVGYDSDGYPERDGAAVESDIHEDIRAYAVRALRIRFAGHGDFYTAADLGLLFERGNPTAVVAPDVMAAFDVPNRRRNSFKLWEEPKGPDFVMELLSSDTWRNDVDAKPGLYEALGVREFWLFDPIGKLPHPIYGWHLDAGGTYAPVPALPDGGHRSSVLGLDLVAHGDGFRFRDPATGGVLPNHAETAAALRAAEARVAELEALRRRP